MSASGGTSGALSPDRPAAARGGGISAVVGLRPGDGGEDQWRVEPRGVQVVWAGKTIPQSGWRLTAPFTQRDLWHLRKK